MTAKVFVGKLADFPSGSISPRELDGHGIVIANVGGQLYAVDDECPHARQPLSQGFLKGCELVCIFHWAIFDLEKGSVVQGPATTPVASFQVQVDGDDVLVVRPDASASD